ncbi:MAG TPA: haloacid dehalogenase type II [Kofleriaceae bacterium]|jgi:2-haloacid dehalogenase|nr:haloacid dehalogenase type II [Kofleriaceae bacterium]
MAHTYRLVVFDLYGTLLDISGMAATLSELLGRDATALLAAWRTAQIERSWELNRLATYEPFDRVTAWALAKVAGELDLALRERLAETWLTVPAHADAAEALRRLGASGVRTAILSNGTRAMIQRAVTAAALSVDEVRSVDDVHIYKPDPRVYQLMDEMAPVEATLFVSSNGWDAEAAKRTGRHVCFIDRGGARPQVEPDFTARSLTELAERVVS